LGMFNGFGTKGASLIPFWSNHLVEVLLNDVALDKEVDISRFE
jgi:glycine oxidase